MQTPRLDPVRFSLLKQMAKSPAHYRYACDHERADTLPFRIGRLVHYMVLGGNYALYDGDRRGNAWKEFAVENDGKDIFTASEMEKARPVADAVLSHSDAARLLEGERELELAWQYCGRDCAGRLDVLHPDRVVELKTASDGEPWRFQRAGLRLAYHAQLAWYLRGAQVARPQPIPREAFIVEVEIAAPYVVTTMRLTPRALEQGDKIARIWLERVINCEHEDYWPGYAECTVPFDVPDDDELMLTIDGEEVAA